MTKMRLIEDKDTFLAAVEKEYAKALIFNSIKAMYKYFKEYDMDRNELGLTINEYKDIMYNVHSAYEEKKEDTTDVPF
jgi:hypothetical protein